MGQIIVMKLLRLAAPHCNCPSLISEGESPCFIYSFLVLLCVPLIVNPEPTQQHHQGTGQKCEFSDSVGTS